MQKSDDIKELAIALNKAQASMEAATKSSDNPFFNSKYADLSEVLSCVKTAFSPNGLSFTQMPGMKDGMVTVETLVMHESGQWITSTASSPMGKNTPQGVGDAVTYLRRYSIAAIAGLGQQDDDGNSNEGQAQSEPNKSKQYDDKPWYNDSNFIADKQNMIAACRDGMTPKAVVASLRESFKVSKEMASNIEDELGDMK